MAAVRAPVAQDERALARRVAAPRARDVVQAHHRGGPLRIVRFRNVTDRDERRRDERRREPVVRRDVAASQKRVPFVHRFFFAFGVGESLLHAFLRRLRRTNAPFVERVRSSISCALRGTNLRPLALRRERANHVPRVATRAPREARLNRLAFFSRKVFFSRRRLLPRLLFSAAALQIGGRRVEVGQTVVLAALGAVQSRGRVSRVSRERLLLEHERPSRRRVRLGGRGVRPDGALGVLQRAAARRGVRRGVR